MENEQNVSDFDIDPKEILSIYQGRWQYLAPLAYSEYLKSGRGAVYVDLSMVEVIDSEMKPQTFYVPENDLQWLEALLDEKTLTFLRNYDPERMVIMLFKFRDGSIKAAFMEPPDASLYPKQLYDEEQRRPVH
jgi:hypothetical protein